MIKKLEIRNFESHEHSIIEFADGLNVVQGVSNSGKSSIVRAICLLAYGDWNGEYVRKGARLSVIRCWTDKGKIAVKRGKKINKWEIELSGKKYIYKNVGKTVPEEVSEVLGFRKVEIGGLPTSLNVGKQLEKHFLIAEINNKSVSPSVAARMIDDLGGIRRVEELFDSLQRDRVDTQKTMREARVRCDEWEERRYDDSRINKMKDEVIEMESVLDDLERGRKRIKLLEQLGEKKTDLLKLKFELSKQRTQVQCINEAVAVMESLKQSRGRLDSLETLLDNRRALKRETSNGRKEMDICDKSLEREKDKFAKMVNNMDICPLSEGKLFEECKELLNAK